MSIEENKKGAAAREFLDSICEDTEKSWDFVCRLRNALFGVDYEEGCPAVDYIFGLIAHHEFEVQHDRSRTIAQKLYRDLKTAVDSAPDGFVRGLVVLETRDDNFFSLASDSDPDMELACVSAMKILGDKNR